MTRIVFRPLTAWADPITPNPKSHTFKASWQNTVDLLRREVEAISDDWDTEAILQVQTDHRFMRRDGGLRADAKVAGHGVVVSFKSRYGPLRYACDTFVATWWRQAPGWQANVRAIALGLEALRKVDRYGIASRGEQYVGWSALGPGGPVNADAMSFSQAKEVLRRYMHSRDELTTGPAFHAVVETLYRRAVKVCHPDVGGDPDEFKLVTTARNLLITETS